MTTPQGPEQHYSGDLNAMGSLKGPVEPDSPAPKGEQPSSTGQRYPSEPSTSSTSSDSGDIPSPSPAEPAAVEGNTHTRDVSPLAVTQRLQSEGRWVGQCEVVRNQMMKQASKAKMTKEAAQAWVYGELDRMYPPLEKAEKATNWSENTAGSSRILTDQNVADGSIQGLGTIPQDWPELPANASLAAELGWVQANRLRVVAERPGRATAVDLTRSLSPAPSWAALGWLETSIRSYAKYVDVAARSTAVDEGEAGVMKRERMAIDEVHALLREMVGFDVCPACGRRV